MPIVSPLHFAVFVAVSIIAFIAVLFRDGRLTGVELLLVPPLLSCPSLLLPEHCTTPVLVSAQVWNAPAETIDVPPDVPVTNLGAATVHMDSVE